VDRSVSPKDHRRRNEGGFTLIELLIVMAIIGILATIAIPAYLGQREKAKVKAIQTSARASLAEIQSILDAYVSGDPYILVGADGEEKCYEEAGAKSTRACSTIYPGTPLGGTYPSFPYGLGTVKQHFLIHRNQGLRQKSPYVSAPLFEGLNPGQTVSDQGRIGLENSVTSITIRAYGPSTTLGTEIFNATVTSR
jgi:prepilin-type N-terminal cleavage/methylation domain-containing protein